MARKSGESSSITSDQDINYIEKARVHLDSYL